MPSSGSTKVRTPSPLTLLTQDILSIAHSSTFLPSIPPQSGWTTWLERVLQGVLHGPAEREFSYIIGRKALTEALKQYENQPKYQRLVIPYAFGEDPDDA